MVTKYKGWDWTELAKPILGVKPAKFLEEEDEIKLREALENKILEAGWNVQLAKGNKKRHYEKVIRETRAFLDKMNEVSMFCNKPLFKGLAKVKEDETFCRYVQLLLSHMWT